MAEVDAYLRARLRIAFEAADHPLEWKGSTTGPCPGSDRVLLETHSFRSAGGDHVRGLLLRPIEDGGPKPAILYIHAHGNAYDIGADELVWGRPALEGPLGPALAEAGQIVFCFDLPCFGTRSGETESAAAKAALWHGRSLAGRMMGELSSALDWLERREDVDAARIGAFGISMGATFGYWLAAIDPRIRAVAHFCCLSDFARLIDLRAHDLHGIYLTVPGLIDLADNGTIAAMVAPRAQLAGIGDRDPLTPPAAADPALARLRAGYGERGGELMVIREPEGGHAESPAMRDAVHTFFRRPLSRS